MRACVVWFRLKTVGPGIRGEGNGEARLHVVEAEVSEGSVCLGKWRGAAVCR